MILTCPRCATRYLADDTLVWATGRTVQCGGCGQRWRAFGGGVDPQSLAPDDPPPEASTPAVSAPPTSSKAAASATPVIEAPGGEDVDEPPPRFRPLEPLTPAAPEAEALAAPALFTTPRASRVRRYGPPGLGAALAVLFMLMLAVGVAIVFRDAIVRVYPPSAQLYKAAGFPPDPETTVPHG
jgi:predicted Zn finger-like uncharacterized protein